MTVDRPRYVWTTDSIGPGWKALVQPLIDYCTEHKIDIHQIKEKFGGLRFYYVGGDEAFGDMVQAAEDRSFKICEKCGETGKPRNLPWVQTLCDAHFKEIAFKPAL